MEIEEDLLGVADSIVQTRNNVLQASEALDTAESKCWWYKLLTCSLAL